MYYTVSNLPKQERPRERLRNVGAENLSDKELIAILLKTGTKDKDVTALATEVLSKYGSLKKLDDATLQSLLEIRGIGFVKAIELLGAIELGKRIWYQKENLQKKKMTTAKKIWENTKYLFANKNQECFYCLYFDNKQKLIEEKLLFMGTINRSVVHPREIFKEAYLLSASSIVCMHNHPSGDASPSHEDILFTKNIMEIGRIQKIPVVDHIIVTDYEYYSFYEKHHSCI